MSSSEIVEIETMEEFEKNLKLYCCLFDIEFTGLQSIIFYENYLSESRCRNKKVCVVNNGRVVSAELLETTITEQDYLIIKKMYRWKKARITNFRRYKKGYLPTDFIKSVLKLYKDKTVLKGIEGKEAEYLSSKEMLNSCYGMTVTDFVRAIELFIEHWLTKEEQPEIDIEKEICKYNNSRSRFLFYPWGVWVTAYARRNLFTGIFEFKDDYVYSDTDSIKVLNAENHLDYIEKYNKYIRMKLENAMNFHKIDISEIAPKNKKGVEKCLGLWDFDGSYRRFKSLGAKRYLVEYTDDDRNGSEKGKVKLTVAGLSKQNAIYYLCENWSYSVSKREEFNSPFEKFNDELYVPDYATGKMTHTYIDMERKGFINDYLGNELYYHELSGVHLEKSDYSLSLAREYSDYLNGIQDIDF